jgi:hypothetical protein
MFGLNALETNLRIWRNVTDSMRDSMRAQQDMMLRMLASGTMSRQVREEGEAATAQVAESPLNGASPFLTPVLAARRAYVQMSGAMIEAQREALQAFVGGARPH